jgi:hypothetical protein
MFAGNSNSLSALAAVGACCALMVGPLGWGTSTAAGAHVLIDDFSAPYFTQNADAGLLMVPGHPDWPEWGHGSGSNDSPKYRQDDLEGDLGEYMLQRDMWLKVPDPSSPRLLSALVATGSNESYPAMLDFASQAPGAEFCIQYDGFDDESEHDFTNGLNNAQALGGLDLTDGGLNDAIEIAFHYLDAGTIQPETMSLKIVITGESGGEAVFTDAIGESPDPFDYTIAFEDFTFNSGTADLFTEVSSITIGFNETAPVPNLDFALTSIAAVPEPSSAILVAIGLLTGMAFVSRGRQRRRS